MTEILDRVAGAIMRAYFDRPEDIREINVSMPDQYDLARAAIEALREPNDAILNSGSRASNTYPAVPEGYVEEPVHRFVVTVMWRAMIDAALGKP